jgi:hypothetical protein
MQDLIRRIWATFKMRNLQKNEYKIQQKEAISNPFVSAKNNLYHLMIQVGHSMQGFHKNCKHTNATPSTKSLKEFSAYSLILATNSDLRPQYQGICGPTPARLSQLECRTSWAISRKATKYVSSEYASTAPRLVPRKYQPRPLALTMPHRTPRTARSTWGRR